MPIKTREEYEFYLEADKAALGKTGRRPRLFGDEIWRFERMLRKIEYHGSQPVSPVRRLYLTSLWLRFHRLSLLLGFSIPPNVFGPGLSIAHRGTIVVNGNVRIGANCRIHVCVSIGTQAGTDDAAPTIGDNVYIGTGAMLYGPIRIADEIAIGANSVVNRSFEEPGITIAGVPARRVGDRGSRGLYVLGTDVAEHLRER